MTVQANTPTSQLAKIGFEELISGLRYWRVWHLLGIRELRHRYIRSKLGQFWLMLSTAMIIAILGVLWSVLWQQPVHKLLPYVGISLIMWTYLSQVLTDCATIFATHASLYRNQKMNFSASIYSVIYRNTLILAHSLIIIVGVVLAFGVPINFYLLQIIPGFFLTCITLVWVGYLVAMICVRYRDVIQVITTWLSVLFFMTPIMWRPDFVPSEYHLLLDCNPLAQYVELLRNPFLGEPVSTYAWTSTAALAFVGGLLSLALIGRYRHRVIFWM